MVDKKEGVLGRWSRRKRGGGAAPVVEAPGGAGTPEPEVEVAALVEDPAASLPENAGPDGAAEPARDEQPAPLPDIDSLDADSDYTPFLGKDVPEKLARKALRKRWRGDPSFGLRDGLDDYDENFRAYFTEAVAKTVKTVYQVAKGAAKQDEPAADAEAESTGGAVAAEPDSTEAADTESADPDSPESPADKATTPGVDDGSA